MTLAERPSATPLVAGIAGLMLSANQTLTLTQIKDMLRQTADHIGDAAGYDASGHSDLYGYGRVNALKAVKIAANEATAPSPEPSIQGPVSLYASAQAPTFEIDTGDRRFFAVEVATEPWLFDALFKSDRTPDNFYGSWGDTPLLVKQPYAFPTAVWQRLNQSDRLYYRAHVADSSSWDNYTVTTRDDQAQNAPFIQIIEDLSPDPWEPNLCSKSNRMLDSSV